VSAASAPRLSGGIVASVLLHGALVVGFFALRPPPPQPMPPIYRVRLYAAPPGERAVGVVQEPQPAPVTPAPVPPATKAAPPVQKTVPSKTRVKPPTPKVATPTPPKVAEQPKPNAQAPTAGGGPTGGKGADVANVDTPGIDFPYPGYINTIVRQIILQFGQSSARFTAEVRFVIRRDGSVDPESIHMVTSSGNYPFDTRALGAVEAAASAKAFGPLPPGFREDILPVTFRFSPSLIR
jgi:periplasmic protein TonB